MRRSLLLLLSVGVVATACKKAPPPAPPKEPAPPAPIDVDDVASCAHCHEAVHAEWSKSAHAMAHQSKDPIFAGVRSVRMKKEGPQIATACANCHTPRAAEAPDAPIAAQGVSCAGCHAVAEVKPDAKGAKAFAWTEGRVLLGPHPASEAGAKVHDGGPVPEHMKDGSRLCLACHGELKTKGGVPMCTTGPEWAEAATDGKSCVDCHMPLVEAPSGSASKLPGHRSHRFWGPRGAWEAAKLDFVASGLKVSAEIEGAKLNVELDNVSQHAMPSGFPGRVVIVLAVGYDEAGEEAWKADPVLLNKVYVDGEGKPVLPPFAVKLAKDSRLEPGETRKLSFDVPKAVAKAEVRIAYRLVPPPLVELLKLEGTPYAGAKPVLKVEATRE